MLARHHLIIGGQRSGKSRHAERMGRAWLQGQSGRRVVVLATARAGDAEMQSRIARHRADRPEGFETHEEPLDLGAALRAASSADTLLIVDCLTLWMTNVLMPASNGGHEVLVDEALWQARRADLLQAMQEVPGPVVFISNEIGQGVIPMSSEVRRFVDELGWLHQDVAQACRQITWMVAGQPFTKDVEVWA